MKITIDRAVLEQVLKALDSCKSIYDWSYSMDGDRQRFDKYAVNTAFTSLREALNAPQPEPVSMETLHQLLREDGYLTNRQAWELAEKLDAAVFTAPPQREWVSLLLDHISMAWSRAYPAQPLSQSALNFARDLESMMKEKNT